MDLHDWESNLIITRDTPAVLSISVGVWETWNDCLSSVGIEKGMERRILEKLINTHHNRMSTRCSLFF